MAATSNYPSAVQMYLKSAIHLWSWSLGSYLRPGGAAFWLHRLLSSRGVSNHVVEPTSILVTRGARRAKTNRLDAVGLLRPCPQGSWTISTFADHRRAVRRGGRRVALPQVVRKRPSFRS